MELRHLRYFVAVAEEGSLTLAAEKRLHTSQPSLSRQIRDLEYEVGVPLMSRSVHGIELTAAGRAFLDHARLALTQADAASAAARRAAQPDKPTFALGFLTGKEIDWLPEAMRILHDELPNIEVTISSQNSPDLADALMRGRLDAAARGWRANSDRLVTLRTALVEICYPTRCAHVICPHRRGEVVERSPAGTNVRLGLPAQPSTKAPIHRHTPSLCFKIKCCV